MPNKLGSVHELNGQYTWLTLRRKVNGTWLRDLGVFTEPNVIPAPVATIKASTTDHVLGFRGNLWEWPDGTRGLVGPQIKRRDGTWYRPVRRWDSMDEGPVIVGEVEGKSGRFDEALALINPPKEHRFEAVGPHRIVHNHTPTNRVAVLIHGNDQTATSWIPGEVDAKPGKVAFAEELLSLGYDLIAIKSPDNAFTVVEFEELQGMLDLIDDLIGRLSQPKDIFLSMGFSAGCAPAQWAAAFNQSKYRLVGATAFNAKGHRRAFHEAERLWSFWAVASNDKVTDPEAIKEQIDWIIENTDGVIDLHEKWLQWPAHRVGEEFLPEWREWHARWISMAP